jgi:hypothetical protein
MPTMTITRATYYHHPHWTSANHAGTDVAGEFKGTKPPTFSHLVEPMDADDWLKRVEKKLQVMQCSNQERVLLASHQLEGPTSEWWDAYVI